MAKGPCQFGGSPAEIYAIVRKALGSYAQVLPPFRAIRKAFEQTEKEIERKTKEVGADISKYLGDIFSQAWDDVLRMFRIAPGSAKQMVSQIQEFFVDAGKIISEILGARGELAQELGEILRKEAWRNLAEHASKAQQEISRVAKKHEAIFGQLTQEQIKERVGLFVHTVHRELLARKKLPELAKSYADLGAVLAGVLFDSLPDDNVIAAALLGMESKFKEWQRVIMVAFLRMLGLEFAEDQIQHFVNDFLNKVRPVLDEIGEVSDEAYKWLEKLAFGIARANVDSPKLISSMLLAFAAIAQKAGVLDEALAQFALKLERQAQEAAKKAEESVQQVADSVENLASAAQKAEPVQQAVSQAIEQAVTEQKEMVSQFEWNWSNIKQLAASIIQQGQSAVASLLSNVKGTALAIAALSGVAWALSKTLQSVWKSLVGPLEERAKFSALLASTKAVTEFMRRLAQISIAQRGAVAASYSNYAWRFFMLSFSEIFLFLKKVWDYLVGTLLLTLGVIVRIISMIFWILNKIFESVEWITTAILDFFGLVRESPDQAPVDMLFDRLLRGHIPTPGGGRARLVPPSQWEKRAGDF